MQISNMATLLVKHLPSILSDDSIAEFFQHYGAIDVKIMQGKMVFTTNGCLSQSNTFNRKGVFTLHVKTVRKLKRFLHSCKV